MHQPVILVPIGHVLSPRIEIVDDYWGDVESIIKLDDSKYTADCLAGLDLFSHLEVIYHLNQVREESVELGARHPRNNLTFPKMGIFAQRAKNRPNRIGLSCCEIMKVSGLNIYVRGLDAVNGTPVIDIKPYMQQFAPQRETSQPEWVNDVMKKYYLMGNPE